MVDYKQCKARPPFSIGLTQAEVLSKFGIDPSILPESTNTPVEETVVPTEESIVIEPVVETPAEVTPDVTETPVEESQKELNGTSVEQLELSAKNIKVLQDNGINTIEELIALVGEEKDAEKLPKVGRAAKLAIIEGLNKWLNVQNPTTSTETN